MMILTAATTAVLTLAIGVTIGNARGYKEGVKHVFRDLTDTGTCAAFGHVAVGYTVGANNVISLPTRMPFVSGAEAPVGAEAAVDVKHKPLVKATYEHPFLSNCGCD